MDPEVGRAAHPIRPLLTGVLKAAGVRVSKENVGWVRTGEVSPMAKSRLESSKSKSRACSDVCSGFLACDSSSEYMV